jgi:hypothetical protein
MRFLGQYIQHFISRFRNDVFLEDVSSGTIASGGNLGLDSNNKIVKANVPTSHDAVTLAGTPDYITISGQEITRNQIDLTADVTGTLPVGNGGTGVTSLGSINISSFNNDSGFTANTGDINRVQISTSSVSPASVTSGNADFSITGSTPIGVSNSGTNITVAASDASTSAKGVASFSSSNFSVSSGAVSLSTGQDSNIVKQVVVTHHHFFMNSSSTTADFFFPYNNLNEASSTSQYYTRTIAPYAGRIIKVLIRPSAGIGTTCKLQFHKITDTTLNFGTAVEEVTNVNLNTAETSVSTAFSSATFSEGDVVNVSLIKSSSSTANIQAVIVWEYTV